MFVAAIAYVDPGSVAANLTAGAQHGYLLVWVLLAANTMAVLIQYLSAKLRLVTGQSLPELLGGRLPGGPRLAVLGRRNWSQAPRIWRRSSAAPWLSTSSSAFPCRWAG